MNTFIFFFSIFVGREIGTIDGTRKNVRRKRDFFKIFINKREREREREIGNDDERSKQRISQIGVQETVRVDRGENVEKEFGSDRSDFTE